MAANIKGVKSLSRDRTPIPETSGNVFVIKDAAEFDALLASNTHVVVDFYADWCPPCRAIAPTFSKLADDHATKARLAFAKVNVDHTQNIASRYNVTAMPTFVFFENGQPQSVAVKSAVGSPSLKDGKVERIRGADAMALRTVVMALSEKFRDAVPAASGGVESEKM